MAFSRPEYDEDKIQWDRIRARLEDEDDANPDEEFAVDGLAATTTDSDDDDDEDADGKAEAVPAKARPTPRRARAAAPVRGPVKTLGRKASPKVVEERLPRIKAAAERVRKLKQVAIDPSRKYKIGALVFDPVAQRFGEVCFVAPSYLRLRLRDGTESAHGKPPMEDRRSFIMANFDRMDNKTMSEILGISVHTMRRLCHEYGLKRHGKPKKEKARRSA